MKSKSAHKRGGGPQRGRRQQQQQKKGRIQKRGPASGQKRKQKQRKLQPLKAGSGAELLEAELLGAEEQASFFRAQYQAFDPTLQLSSGQALPSAGHLAVSSRETGGKRALTELGPWLKDICGDQWPELLEKQQQHTTTGSSSSSSSTKSAKSQQTLDLTQEETGAPFVIIVTSSGPRACELYNTIKSQFSKITHARKLFSKIKLEEQVAMLRSASIHIAIGTPHRIAELCRDGSLKLHRCKFVVLDMWKNVKGISLLVRGAEVQTDFHKLYFEHLNEKILNGEAKLAMF